MLGSRIVTPLPSNPITVFNSSTATATVFIAKVAQHHFNNRAAIAPTNKFSGNTFDMPVWLVCPVAVSLTDNHQFAMTLP